MLTVLILVHLMLAAALIGVILIQRSEGGGLGIGGGSGGGMGGLMSGRGAANLLTRTTAVLAAGFMLSSLLLAYIANQQNEPTSIIDEVIAVEEEADVYDFDTPIEDIVGETGAETGGDAGAGGDKAAPSVPLDN